MTVKMKTFCKLNFIFVHRKSKKQEIKAYTTFILLSWSRNWSKLIYKDQSRFYNFSHPGEFRLE